MRLAFKVFQDHSRSTTVAAKADEATDSQLRLAGDQPEDSPRVVVKRSRLSPPLKADEVSAGPTVSANETDERAGDAAVQRKRVHVVARTVALPEARDGEAPTEVSTGLSEAKRQLMEPCLTLHQVIAPPSNRTRRTKKPEYSVAQDEGSWDLGPSQHALQRRTALEARIQNLADVLNQGNSPVDADVAGARKWKELEEAMRELRTELDRPWGLDE